MPPDEMARTMEKYTQMCTCPACPNYNRCAKNAKETFFCANGKVSCA